MIAWQFPAEEWLTIVGLETPGSVSNTRTVGIYVTTRQLLRLRWDYGIAGGLVLSNRLVGRSRMAIQLTPTRIKGSKYLLIPKDLAQLLEIDDKSILSLTIEDTDKGQRLVYSIRERSSNSAEN
jgi:hypothetical protein